MRWVPGVRALVSHVYRSRLDSRGVSTVFLSLYSYSALRKMMIWCFSLLKYRYIFLQLDLISRKFNIKIHLFF